MTTAGYFNSVEKLKEGKSYPFRVCNMVTLQDERNYYILEDPFNIRHLLPSWFYTKYGIKQGKMINCDVEKINCTGRVYLEPEHPYYSKNCVREFHLLSIQINEQRRKKKLILTDIFENEIEVDCPEELVKSISGLSYVECIIVCIRKGKPVLTLSKYFREKMKMKLTSRQTEPLDKYL